MHTFKTNLMFTHWRRQSWCKGSTFISFTFFLLHCFLFWIAYIEDVLNNHIYTQNSPIFRFFGSAMILSVFWNCFLGYMTSKSIHFKHKYFTEYLLKNCWYSKSTKTYWRVFQLKRLLLYDIAIILFGKM